VRLGRVALDGTKLIANASRHKAMSYDHIVPKIEQLQAEVDTMLAEAEAVDEAEDEAYGADHRGDEIAPELARRESRLESSGPPRRRSRRARDKAEAAARTKAEEAGKSAQEVTAAGRAAAERAKLKPSASATSPTPRPG